MTIQSILKDIGSPAHSGADTTVVPSVFFAEYADKCIAAGATLAFMYAMLRSMIAAWVLGGVRWRGTHYPLRELRKHNSPFGWERAAAKPFEPKN